MYTLSKVPAMLLLAACVLVSSMAVAKDPATTIRVRGQDPPPRILVIDGSPVHNIGNLNLHTGNWGAFGSQPGSGQPFQEAPSAEWPSGSGVEYLYVAGLWVGALNGGIPAVSTAAYETEFRPTQDPIDVVYYSSEGAVGGKRLPDPNADDDGDGMIDEEWLDGHDNDGDAMVDEDFAAISNQMQSCWYTDDQPEAIQIFPEHNPLHIEVRQRSYQWSDTDFDDFVGFDYTITNTGNTTLTDVYLGIFFDGDAGSRNTPNYWQDDATDFRRLPLVCTGWGATSVDIGYVYDADGDNGQTTGGCGVLLLDHPTDPTGAVAPPSVNFDSYRTFRGDQSFEEGGHPTNDFERYEVMSSGLIEAGAAGGDVSFLVSVGPFDQLAPGESLEFRIAVVGGGVPGGNPFDLTQNAAAARLTYEGLWYDLDSDLTTGVAGRETPVYGPATNVVVDSCQSPPIIVPIVPAGQVVWVNDDCARESWAQIGCGYHDSDSTLFRTGIEGREGQVHWVSLTGLPVPVLITQIGVRASHAAAVLSWDIFADEPIDGFKIHRSKAGGVRVVLPSSALLPPTTRSFTDDDVVSGETYGYTLVAVLPDGAELVSQTVETTIPSAATELHQNYPNPFNPATTIAFTLAQKSAVNLSIFTPDGKLVVTLVDGVLPAGFTDVPWDGKDTAGNYASSGIYFYRLKAGKTVLSRKMVYLK